MKTTYKYIALAALALGFAACTQDDDFAPQQKDIVQIASANIATEVQTRVNTLADGTIFENADRILLVNNSRDNKNSGTYTYSGTDWSLAEGLVLYASEANATNDFTAYYPAASDEDYTLPADQSTEAGIKQADRMVATTNGVAKGAAVALSFERRNAMVTIVPTMAEQFTDQSVSSMQIAGITPYHPAEGYTAIIAPSGEGFTVSVSVSGVEQPLTATTSTAIEAGKRYTFNLKVGKDLMTMETVSVAPWTQQGIGDGNAEEIPYLTFTANAQQTMKITEANTGWGLYWDESMEYSVNGSEWAQLAAETYITFGGDGGMLRLRGKSLKGTSAGGETHSKVSFGNSDVNVACSGDIRTLVDYENYATVSTANAKFVCLFYGCVCLTTAPELPATTLTKSCYNDMFNGCTSLTEAPEILPATELAERCYDYMFNGCTNLTKAPELSTTALAEHCYNGMFSGCTGLTTAPELPAATLVNSCYKNMFKDCSALNNITMLATDISATDCLLEWVSGVAPSGTFYKNSGATWDETGTSGIPEGWTVVNKE